MAGHVQFRAGLAPVVKQVSQLDPLEQEAHIDKHSI